MKTVVLYHFEQNYDEVDFDIISVNHFPDSATNEDIDAALFIPAKEYKYWVEVPQFNFVPATKTVYVQDAG